MPENKVKLHKVKPLSFKEEFGSDNKKEYPEFSVRLVDLPEANDWEVGEKYKILMHVQQSAMSKSKTNKGRVTFEILSIGGYKNPKKPSKRYPRG